jgi:polysaccharide export outer membrane protein
MNCVYEFAKGEKLMNEKKPVLLLALAIVALVQLPTSRAQTSHDSSRANRYSASTASPAIDTRAPSTVGPANNSPDYLIGVDDMLDVNVRKEQELTRTLQVRRDGKISMPFLNDVQAAGLTTSQLADSISEKLKKYITSPQVTVMVTQTNSQRVFVIGEVGRPGAYTLLPGMTILQALSTAGGLTPYANAKKIFLMRTENRSQTKYAFNYKGVLAGHSPEQNRELKPGDTVVVP